jgi:hypothetical protein
MNMFSIIFPSLIAGPFILVGLLCIFGMAVSSMRGYLKYKFKWNDPKRASEELHDFWIGMGAGTVSLLIGIGIIAGTIYSFNDKVDCVAQGYTYHDQVCYSELERAN